MKKIDFFVAFWALISMLFWCWYLFVSKSALPFVLYYCIWIGVIGSLVWYYRVKIRAVVGNWQTYSFVKFLILGYGMVLLEEIFAALSNHLTEGFSLPLYFIRILQFWDFNILAFTGFIFGWYFLVTKFRYTSREIFYLAGIWGIYAEKVYVTLFTNITAFVFIAVPTILTYGLIITPAMFSVRAMNQRTLVPILKYPLTYLLIFIFSIIPVLILTILRIHFGYLFPPTKFIP